MSFESLTYEYLKKKIQCIPVNGKHPSIDGWNDVIVDEDMVDYWYAGGNIRRFTGIAMLIGERSDGVCALDVDTDDTETIERIHKYLDIEYICSKRGAKGFTTFFRLKGGIKPHHNLVTSIKRSKTDKKIVCEIFLGNKYVVLPPSEHPDGGHYKWITPRSLLDIDLDELPEISYEKLMGLETVIQSASLDIAKKYLPIDVDPGGNGRWSTITSAAATYITKLTDDNIAIAELLRLDETTFPGNQYFLSREKLGKAYQGDNPHANCVVWYQDFKRNIMMKDADLVGRITEKYQVETVTFRSETSWAAPQIFSERELSRSATELPLEIFPPIFQEYAVDHAERMAVNPDGILGTMLLGLGTLMQGRVLIYPKGKADGFCVRPNLFAMTVGPSGVKKDSIMGCGLHFFEEVALTVNSKTPEEIKSMEILEQRLYVQNKKRKKAFELEDDEALETVEERISELKAEIAKHNLSRPTLRFQSGTTEKLIETMYKNQERCILIHQSEFRGLMAQMEKKGNEPMRPLLLKAANGTDREGYSHMTMAGLNCDIKKLSACLLTGVQDDVLNSYLAGVKKGSVDNDGFLQRFLYFFVKSSGKRMVSREVEPNYDEIQNKFWLAYNINQTIDVEFTKDARELFLDHEFQTQMNRMSKGTDSALESLQSKYIGLLPKIAYLLEFMWCKKGTMPTVVSKEAVERAIHFIEWQRVTMEAFWYNSDASIIYRTAQRIIEDSKMRTIKSGSTITELKKYYREVDTVVLKRVLKVLEDRNWINLVESGREYAVILHPELI